MARARMLSKSLSCSRRFNSLVDTAGPLCEFSQLLFALLIPHVDDFGRMAGDPQSVKLLTFPGSPRPLAEFESALQSLHDVKLIQLYIGESDDMWLQVNKFDDHQQGLHKRTESRIPNPPGDHIPGISWNSGKFLVARARGTELELELKRTELEQEESTVAPRLSAAGNGNGHRKPRGNQRVIVRLIHSILDDPKHPSGFTDLLDVAKEACAQKHIAYNSSIVGAALESAIAQRASRAS